MSSLESSAAPQDTTGFVVSGQVGQGPITGELTIKHWQTYNSGPLTFKGKSLGSYRTGTLCADEPGADNWTISKEQWLMMHSSAGGNKTTLMVRPGVVTTTDDGHALSVDYKIYSSDHAQLDGAFRAVVDALEASKGGINCHAIEALAQDIASRLESLHTESSHLSRVYDVHETQDHEAFKDARFMWGTAIANCRPHGVRNDHDLRNPTRSVTAQLPSSTLVVTKHDPERPNHPVIGILSNVLHLKAGAHPSVRLVQSPECNPTDNSRLQLLRGLCKAVMSTSWTTADMGEYQDRVDPVQTIAARQDSFAALAEENIQRRLSNLNELEGIKAYISTDPETFGVLAGAPGHICDAYYEKGKTYEWLSALDASNAGADDETSQNSTIEGEAAEDGALMSKVKSYCSSQ
jgi:hypothetical protein